MKEIFIERQKNVLRIAIKENDRLVTCFIEEEGLLASPGQIYKGVVKNIVPAIKCAFIDIGTGKNAFMYLDAKFNNKNVKKGDELIVEVVKESMGTKGAKVSNAITMPGRYAVIETMNNTIEFSKKINNKHFEEELKEKIQKPSEVGIMIRTNAEKVSIEEINAEINKLYETYKEVVRVGTYSNKPKLLYDTGGSIGKVLRDIVDESTVKVVIDNEKDYTLIKRYIEDKTEIITKLELHSNAISIMDYYGIEKEILNLRHNKVELACGGSIVIDKTEAMYVIDVNSSKNIKGNSIEKTVKTTNLQAAEEIARQIRLRNLGGIIVVDFIDTNDKNVQEQIMKVLHKGFFGDKNKTIVYPFTELSIVQIARSRKGKAISEYIEENCNICKGSGKRLKLSYLTYLIRNDIKKIEDSNISKSIFIEISSVYKNNILKDVNSFVSAIEAEEKEVYVDFVKNNDIYKVEPLIYESQKNDIQHVKIYG